jgi:hypothetical protein
VKTADPFARGFGFAGFGKIENVADELGLQPIIFVELGLGFAHLLFAVAVLDDHMVFGGQGIFAFIHRAVLPSYLRRWSPAGRVLPLVPPPDRWQRRAAPWRAFNAWLWRRRRAMGPPTLDRQESYLMSDTLTLSLSTGDVVIRLRPDLAPLHVERITRPREAKAFTTTSCSTA